MARRKSRRRKVKKRTFTGPVTDFVIILTAAALVFFLLQNDGLIEIPKNLPSIDIPIDIPVGKVIGVPGDDESSNASVSTTLAPADRENIVRIASWNIENFGKSKAADGERMREIAKVLKDFDLIAVQEISNVREKSDVGCPRNEDSCPGDPACGLVRDALEKYLNEEYGRNYKFVFSDQVKDERYLYIFDPEKVTLLSSGLVEDVNDSLPVCDQSPENTGLVVRQPFRADFRAGDFDYTLLTVHTSPSVNVRELEGLEYFYRKTFERGEPDVIVLGDLNADCSYLEEDESISFRNGDYLWIVDDGSDTTVAKTDCAYDRFIYSGATVEDYTGDWGIYKDIDEDVSDHYLVWAEFRTDMDSA